MRLTKPMFFYHLTHENWGPKKTLIPLASDKCRYRGPDEPKVPRICVAPSVAKCLSSVYFASYGNVFIYRTYRKIRASYVWGVPDVSITSERWITNPVTFFKIGKLSTHLLSKIQGGCAGMSFGSDDADDLEVQRLFFKKVEGKLKKLICRDSASFVRNGTKLV